MTPFSASIRNSTAALAVFAGLWTLAASGFDSYVLPSPLTVLGEIPARCNPALWAHARATLLRVGLGYAAAMAMGTIAGVAAARLGAQQAMAGLLVLCQAIPGVILGVVLLLVCGPGHLAPVGLIVMLTTPLVAINTADRLAKADPLLEDVIRSFGGRTAQVIRDLYLPRLVPAIRTNATVGLVMATKVGLLGEFVASDRGIGYLLNVAKVYFDMPAVFFYLVLVLAALLAAQTLIDGLFAWLGGRFLFPE